MGANELVRFVVVPIAGFACLWIGIGVLLWFNPWLWDISTDAAKSPPLVEEDMLL